MNKKALAIACLATFTYVSALALVIPFLPFQVLHFGGSYAYAGGIFSAFSAASFLSAPLWGRACDNWGVRSSLLLSGFLTFCSYLILFFADSLTILYASRILAGFSAGWLIGCQTLIARSTDSEHRTRGLGLLGASFGCGFASGHAFSAWLIGGELAPSRAPVLVACMVSILACLIASLLITPKSSRDKGKEKERRAYNRWGDLLSVFSNRALALLALIYFFVSLLFHGFEGVFALWVEEFFAFGPRDVASLLAYSSIVVIFVQGGLVGLLAKRWGEERVVMLGLVFLLLGFACLALATSIVVLLLSLTLIAIGISLNNPSLQSLVSKTTSRQGDGFGLLQSFSSLSRMLAPFAFALFAATWGGRVLFIFFAIAYLVIFMLIRIFAFFPPRRV